MRLRADVAKRVLRLEHLPIVGQALRRLRIAERVDEVVPPDPRCVVTTGQCVEALIVAVLSGTHTLYRVDQLLAGFDLKLGLGWDVEAASFHDERLARALSALVKHGLDKATSACLLAAVQEYAVDLATIRLDSTALTMHGEYACGHQPEDPESPSAIPHVTKGKGKDATLTVKQIVFGLAVSDDGTVPIYGRAASGNRHDSPELRFLMKRVAERVPDPRGVTVIGDSKFFAGPTLLLVRELGMRFVTLVPKSVKVRAKALHAYREAEREGRAALLHEKIERGQVLETWHGCSFEIPYDYDPNEDGRTIRIPLRLLVVRSTALERRKRGRFEKDRAKERQALEREAAQLRRVVHRCESDAHEAKKRLDDRRTPRFHRLASAVTSEDRFVKRHGPGRPRKGEIRDRETVWTLNVEVILDHAAFEAAVAEECCFVIATNHLTTGKNAKSDREVFDAYHGQHRIEGAFHWLKGLLDFAPVFLKKEERIAALAQVYVLALMVYALIQREARVRLSASSSTIPGNLKPTAAPTTDVVFRLFEKVTTSRRAQSDDVVVENLTTAQAHGYEALGIDLAARPRVRLRTPRRPGPGDRGYYARIRSVNLHARRAIRRPTSSLQRRRLDDERTGNGAQGSTQA